MDKIEIKVLHVARRFISKDLSELKTGYDLEHFNAIGKLVRLNTVIFQSKEKNPEKGKIENFEYFLMPSLWNFFFKIKEIAKKHDLIVAQNPFLAGLFCVIIGRIVKKPVIVSVHGYKFTVGKIQSSMKKFVCKNATKIRANSQIVKDTIISWGIEENKISVIEDRVDCNHFSPEIDGSKIREELGIEEKMIISVGSLIQIKGFDTLLESIPLVKKEIDGVKFIIAGEGSEREKLLELIKKLKISNDVILVGNINYHDLPKYYAASDLFVHPSNVESMGRVMLEAQAAGKPVVATNIGGIPEAVSKDSAILVPSKNSKELANAIIKILKNEELSKNMSIKGRELVVESFEFWKQEEKLIKFYEYVVNGFKI